MVLSTNVEDHWVSVWLFAALVCNTKIQAWYLHTDNNCNKSYRTNKITMLLKLLCRRSIFVSLNVWQSADLIQRTKATCYAPLKLFHYMLNHPILVICPIAIAYSMGQIIKSFCVCPCMRVCVRLWTLSRSHFFVDFHQIGHRRVNPQK